MIEWRMAVYKNFHRLTGAWGDGNEGAVRDRGKVNTSDKTRAGIVTILTQYGGFSHHELNSFCPLELLHLP